MKKPSSKQMRTIPPKKSEVQLPLIKKAIHKQSKDNQIINQNPQSTKSLSVSSLKALGV